MAKVTVVTASKVPTLEEILEANGVNLAKAKGAVAELAARFPDGIIPDAAIQQWLDTYFSSTAIRNALVEAGRAWAKLATTGRGPVGHAGAEVA